MLVFILHVGPLAPSRKYLLWQNVRVRAIQKGLLRCSLPSPHYPVPITPTFHCFLLLSLEDHPVVNGSYIFTEHLLCVDTGHALLHSYSQQPLEYALLFPLPIFLGEGAEFPESGRNLSKAIYLEHNQYWNWDLSDTRDGVQTTPFLKLSDLPSVWVFLKLSTSRISFLKTFC